MGLRYGPILVKSGGFGQGLIKEKDVVCWLYQSKLDSIRVGAESREQ
jgi:hypothetical protein